MRILSRRPNITQADEYIPWLPAKAAIAKTERKLGCEPGTGRAVIADLHAATDHLWPTKAPAVRPPCRILEASAVDVEQRFVTATAPTISERLAAIGLVYAARAVTR